MGSNTRLVYLTPARLLCQIREREVEFSYLPICRICKRYLLYTIAIVKGDKKIRGRYICMQCGLRIYTKAYLINLIKKHIGKLSRGKRSRGYYKMYKQLLTQLNKGIKRHKIKA